MKADKISYSCAVSRFVMSFILLASLLVLPKAHAAIKDSFTVDQLKYIVLTEEPASKTGTVSVESASQNISGDITIPASVANKGITYSVTLIGYGAFSNLKKLKSIVIPESVTSLGEGAFIGCSSLTSIVIPDSVTSIDRLAFIGCSKLSNIIIPNSVTSIGEGAFYECSSLANVTIGKRVTTIGDEAFEKCSSLTTIEITNSVTSIG
ncbi:MAG: leucine-rich repeat domain-containing protein, partial [Clostridia bacterium]|nr:leucine-rich repeat domain-containing protein [Clostridia bacterium]